MKSVLRYSILMFVGGIVYYYLEIINRGFSHWTMALVGGICFVLIGIISQENKWNVPLIGLMGISAVLITVVELVAGIVLNLWLKMDIWDYSSLPLNFLGQICLPFTLIWFFLSFPAILLHSCIKNWFLVRDET